MKTLEIIHLRLAGDSPQTLVDVIRKSIGSEPDLMEVRIYRHTRLETDLAVHLHRESAGRNDRVCDVGIRLASLLREYGMVEHTLWVDGKPSRQPCSSSHSWHRGRFTDRRHRL